MDIPTGHPLEQATPYIKALGGLWNLGALTTISAQNMDYSSAEEIEEKISSATAEGLRIARRW
jgi:FMN-dependent NADH-azoreductase